MAYRKAYSIQEYLNSALCPVGHICLDSGKEAFTWLSNLNAILGMLEKGGVGAGLSEIQLQTYC